MILSSPIATPIEVTELNLMQSFPQKKGKGRPRGTSKKLKGKEKKHLLRIQANIIWKSSPMPPYIGMQIYLIHIIIYISKNIYIGQEQYNSITMPSEQEFQNALQLYNNCKENEVYSYCNFVVLFNFYK